VLLFLFKSNSVRLLADEISLFGLFCYLLGDTLLPDCHFIFPDFSFHGLKPTTGKSFKYAFAWRKY